MKTEILVSEIRCYAYHGCMEEEGIIGGEYVVDIRVNADVSKAVNEDDLQKTVDYVVVHKLVLEEMKKRSKLIEHVAGRILYRITDIYRFVHEVEVKVTKFNPPVDGQIGSASVILSGKGNNS